MLARTIARLIIALAAVSLAFLIVFRVAVPAMKAPLSADVHQQRVLRLASRPISGVILLGNIITALIYVLLYGFAAGAFN